MSNLPYARIVAVAGIVTLLMLFVSMEALAQPSTQDGESESASSAFSLSSDGTIVTLVGTVIVGSSMALWILLAVGIVRSREKLKLSEKRAARRAQSPAKSRAERRADLRADMSEVFHQVIGLGREILQSGMAPVVVSAGTAVTLGLPSTDLLTVSPEALERATIEVLKNPEIRNEIAIMALENPEVEEKIRMAIERGLKPNYEDLRSVIEMSVSSTIENEFREFIKQLSTLYATQPILRSSPPETEAPTQ